MKKILCFLIILIMCVVMCISANATEENRPLTELLTESQNAGGLVPELDSSRLPDDISSVAGKPVLVLCQVNGWEDFSKFSMEELYDKCEYIEYIVLDESLKVFREKNTNEKYEVGSMIRHEIVPTFIADILNGSSRQAFLGTEHNVQNIICIRGFSLYFVYYITDGGTFVRVYEYYPPDEPCKEEFSLRDFQIRFEYYVDFYFSDWYQRDKYGQLVPKAGGHFFLGYIKNPSWFHEKYRYSYLFITERYPLLIPLVICFAVLSAKLVTHFVVRRIEKKKAKATFASTESDE